MPITPFIFDARALNKWAITHLHSISWRPLNIICYLLGGAATSILFWFCRTLLIWDQEIMESAPSWPASVGLPSLGWRYQQLWSTELFWIFFSSHSIFSWFYLPSPPCTTLFPSLCWSSKSRRRFISLLVYGLRKDGHYWSFFFIFFFWWGASFSRILGLTCVFV